MNINYLLSELNEYAMKATPEAFRIATIIRLRYAMLRIGKDIVGIPEDIEIEVIKGKYHIEDQILFVQDVGLVKGEYRGMQARRGNYDLSTLIYSISEKEISFPNYPKGKLWIRAYKFPLDETGQIDIPMKAYAACLKYCAAEMVAKMPTSPYWPDRWNMKNEADAEIRVATGLLAERTPAHLRLERHQR